MPDVLLRGVPAGAVYELRERAALLGVSPGDLVARLLVLLELLGQPGTSVQVQGLLVEAGLAVTRDDSWRS
jgi:hypothetical protein